MKRLNLASVGILAGAAAVGYLLYVYTKPASRNQYLATGLTRNTDGGAYFKTFQNDSALNQDYGLTRT